MPTAVHDFIDAHRGQLRTVQPEALRNGFHDLQIWLILKRHFSFCEHFPHQNSYTRNACKQEVTWNGNICFKVQGLIFLFQPLNYNHPEWEQFYLGRGPCVSPFSNRPTTWKYSKWKQCLSFPLVLTASWVKENAANIFIPKYVPVFTSWNQQASLPFHRKMTELYGQEFTSQ